MQQQILDDRYEVDRLIGEGGMARVYIGRDRRLNRRVAIKIPRPQYIDDADFLNRFRHEALAAASLAHPAIVDVYDVGQEGSIHYIVMEYVDGFNLKALLNREAPLTVDRAVKLAIQVALGLHAAHRAGLVHRDIKPQNIIVTADGHARITDFGVAKGRLSTAFTETGVAFGTVDYLSPEQAQGIAATAQSDLYSLGVVLFEMLSGRLPFSGDTAVAIAMKHASEPPPSLCALNPHVPSSLERIVFQLLAKDPAQRPQSALALAQALEQYEQVAQQATVAQVRPSNPPPPLTAPVRVGGTDTSGQTPVLPPRPAMRSPRQDGLGCGVFLVGMLVLAGVLGLVLLFSTGFLNGLFAGFDFSNDRPTPAVPGTPPTVSVTPTGTTEVQVPDLAGLDDAAARTILRELELQPVSRQANSVNVPQGRVISQTVAAGTALSRGEAVTYTVSLGPALVSVPDVTGTPSGIARSTLSAIGLNVELIDEPNQRIDRGFVVRQSPSAGLRIPMGETVQVFVSLGDVVRFPAVIGLDRAAAEGLLSTTAGVELVFVDEQGPDRLPGFSGFRSNEVVSAQLEGGAGLNNGDFIPRGSRIILGVRAPDPVPPQS
jgi:serine/threonine protein kinase